MKNGSARSILAGAFLASGLVLGAPLAAEAAAHAPSSVDFDGIQVPAAKAELTQYGSVADGTPVYSEPGSSDMALLIPHTRPTVAAKDQIRMSPPFTAGTSESWVAVQVPDASHGTDPAKSNLAEAGVAYVRAANVTIGPYVTNGPTSDPTPAAGPYPRTKADLTTTTSTSGSTDLFRHPAQSPAEILGTPTNKWGSTMRSSDAFIYEGKKWVAVEVGESIVPGGIAYMRVIPGVTVSLVHSAPSTAVTAPAVSVPNEVVTSEAPAAPLAPAAPMSLTEIIFKTLNVLVAALAMAATLVLIKRRTVEA